MGLEQQNIDRAFEYQKTLAETGIQIKAADAKAAGIHPIYAMGSGGPSAFPVYGGGTGTAASGGGFSGQNVSRAYRAESTALTRQREELNDLAIIRGGLENDLVATQVASSQMELARQTGPAWPSGQVDVNPKQTTSTTPGKPWLEAAPTPSLGKINLSPNAYGKSMTLPGSDIAIQLISNPISGGEWAFREKIIPMVQQYRRGFKTLGRNVGQYQKRQLKKFYKRVKTNYGKLKRRK